MGSGLNLPESLCIHVLLTRCGPISSKVLYFVFVSLPTEGDRDAPERIALITGSAESVSMAESMVNDLVANARVRFPLFSFPYFVVKFVNLITNYS